MNCIARPDPLKAIGQLRLERPDIAPQSPLQLSFNAASLSPHPHFLLTLFRLGYHRAVSSPKCNKSTMIGLPDLELTTSAIHFI